MEKNLFYDIVTAPLLAINQILTWMWDFLFAWIH